MKKEQIEEKYKDYFKHCYDFSIGKGWLPLILTFCEKVSHEIKEIYNDRENAVKFLSSPGKYTNIEYWGKRSEEVEKLISILEKTPFEIVQIKEKFGGLRLYIHGGPDKFHEWTYILEALSYNICEDCGRNAEVRTKGWVRTLCLDCANNLKENDSNLTWKEIKYD